MTDRLSWAVVAVFVVGSVACGGGGASRHGVDAAGPDAGDTADAMFLDAVDMGSSTPADASKEELGTFELPRLIADPSLTRRLAAGPAFLVGDSGDACSQGTTPGADRWCAFYRPAPDKTAELWVLNVTKVAKGTAIACDGSSDDCKRLTPNLWTGTALWGRSHPYAHRFTGDTLIFYAEPLPGMRQPYEGFIWAWQPGWSAPHQLTSARGVDCSVDPRTAATFCVDDAVIERDGTGLFDRPHLRSFDLLAGKITVEPSGPLPKVSRVSNGKDDLYWSAHFSPDGEYLAFADTELSADVIKVVRTAEVGRATPATILSGAADWEIAHDGTRIYFLSGLDRTLGDQASGTLMLADFPTGTNPMELQTDVIFYERLGAHAEVFSDVDRGLVTTRLFGTDSWTSHLLRDREKPSDLFNLGTNLRSVHVATDLRHTIYMSSRGNPVAFVTQNDGSGTCLLTSDPAAETYGTHFTHDGRRAVWIEYGRNQSESEEGWHAQPETCGDKTKFGDYVLGYALVGSDYVIFEGGDREDSTSWLQYTAIKRPGQAMPLPTVVKEHANATLGVFTAAGETWIVFAIQENDPDTGLYLHGPLRRD